MDFIKSSLYIAGEIEDLIDNTGILNTRLLSLLHELAEDNKAIFSANLAAIKLKEGELSEEHMLIALNKYRASRSSVVE